MYLLSDEAEDGPHPLEDQRLLGHLWQHGVNARLQRLHDAAACGPILARCREHGADMLVAGLRRGDGHDPSKPGNLGSDLIRAQALPVFCSS